MASRKDIRIGGLLTKHLVKTYVHVSVGPQDPAAPPLYDLYAVSQHSGSIAGGHYVAVCKNAKNGKW